MDTEGLYQGLRRIQARGEIGNAYGGCGTVEEESNVLVDFFECIMEKYKDSMPLWAEAFIQIFDWQFQTFHEGAESYYSNFYGNSEYATIIRTADYLNENGYDEIWKPYISAAVDCERYQYPKEKTHLLPDDWMNKNEKTVWNFYVNILEKHADELTMKEVDVKLDGQDTDKNIFNKEESYVTAGRKRIYRKSVSKTKRTGMVSRAETGAVLHYRAGNSRF